MLPGEKWPGQFLGYPKPGTKASYILHKKAWAREKALDPRRKPPKPEAERFRKP